MLQKQIADLHKKFDASVKADRATGLDLLRQGQDFLEAGHQGHAHHRLADAFPSCHRTMKYYGKLLGNHLGQGRVNREEVRLPARHLSVAVVRAAVAPLFSHGGRQDNPRSTTQSPPSRPRRAGRPPLPVVDREAQR